VSHDEPSAAEWRSAPSDELDALTSEPPEFAEGRASVLTPMGEVESIGDFARGLGARRAQIAIFGLGGLVLLFAVMAALR
jgi:hypothetical protein